MKKKERIFYKLGKYRNPQILTEDQLEEELMNFKFSRIHPVTFIKKQLTKRNNTKPFFFIVIIYQRVFFIPAPFLSKLFVFLVPLKFQ